MVEYNLIECDKIKSNIKKINYINKNTDINIDVDKIEIEKKMSTSKETTITISRMVHGSVAIKKFLKEKSSKLNKNSKGKK